MTIFFDLCISDNETVIKSLPIRMNVMFPNLSCWLFFRCSPSTVFEVIDSVPLWPSGHSLPVMNETRIHNFY